MMNVFVSNINLTLRPIYRQQQQLTKVTSVTSDFCKNIEKHLRKTLGGQKFQSIWKLFRSFVAKGSYLVLKL